MKRKNWRDVLTKQEVKHLKEWSCKLTGVQSKTTCIDMLKQSKDCHECTIILSKLEGTY